MPNGYLQTQVACDGFETVISQLDSDGLRRDGFSYEVVGEALAQGGENLTQRVTVSFGVQVTFEGGFSADGYWL